MTCDYCDSPAIANYQRIWVRYSVSLNGDYGRRMYQGQLNEDDEPTDENNVHVCKRHESTQEWKT